jgi:hypothetical protein
MDALGPNVVQTPENVAVYSNSFNYFSKQLNAFSLNYVKIVPQGPQSASPGSILSFCLPSNTIIQVDALVLFFKLTSGVTVANAGVTAPRFTTSLIQRCSVSISGIQIGNSVNFNNMLAYLLQMATLDRSAVSSGNHALRSPQGWSTEDVMTAAATAPVSFQGGSRSGGAGPLGCYWDNDSKPAGAWAVPGGGLFNAPSPAQIAARTQNEVSVLNNGTKMYCDYFPGLSSIKPSYLNTALCGQIRVDLLLESSQNIFAAQTLDADGATTVAAAHTAISWSLEDCYMYCPVISLQDGVYEASLYNYIARGQLLSIPFRQYWLFSDSLTGGAQPNASMRVSVRSACINRFIYGQRSQNFQAETNSVETVGTRAHGQTTKFFGSKIVGDQRFRMSVNNISCPANDMVGNTEVEYYRKAALNHVNSSTAGSIADNRGGIGAQVDSFVLVYTLADPKSGMRTRSGLDSMGTNTAIILESSGDGASLVPAGGLQQNLFVEATSQMKVGMNRSLTIVN